MMEKKTALEIMFDNLNDIHEGSDEQVEKELANMGINVNRARENFMKTIEKCKRGNKMETKLYCIEVEREMEEMCVLHRRFAEKPSYEQILKIIMDEDMGYDDDYGRFDYYEVKE
jgi:hypothetical protein